MMIAGWFGIPMLVIFCISVGFAASRLGKSWVILEERWPKYRLPARQPYMEIAGKAFGNIGRSVTHCTDTTHKLIISSMVFHLDNV